MLIMSHLDMRLSFPAFLDGFGSWVVVLPRARCKLVDGWLLRCCYPEAPRNNFESQSFTIQPHGRAKISLSNGRALPACNTTLQTRLWPFLSKPLSA